jgi:acetyl esterase
MRAVRSAMLAACTLLCGGAANADITRLPPDVATAIAAMGPNLTRDVGVKTNALMGPLAPTTPPPSVTIAKDVAYGDDPLQKMDIYTPANARGRPIVVFFHGGGFVREDKGSYGNVPSYLSAHGLVAVNANYRLAPKVVWPAESQDVGTVVAFLKAHAKDYGGNAQRIFLVGHSAGANIVAGYVLDPSLHPKSGPGVVAAVLISLPASRAVSITDPDRDLVYYGKDKSLYQKRAPASHLNESKLPLMLVTAEFDPVALAPDAYDMAARTCVRDGKCPAFLYLKGHNHISEIGSVGSKDDELGSRILDFVRTTKLTERTP